MKNNQIVSVLLMIILFICTALLDYGYNKFEDIFAPESRFAPLHWYKLVTSLLWAVMIMGVAWYVFAVNHRNLGVALTYLLVGILALFFQTFILELYSWLGPLAQPTQGIRMRLAGIFSSHLSLTYHTAAMITVIGTAGLLPDRWLRATRGDARQDQS